MTSVQQEALFRRDDLLFEFDRRQALALEHLRRCSEPRLLARVAAAHASAEVRPLEVATQDFLASRDLRRTLDARGAVLQRYAYRHRYSGDEQLWHMDPGLDDKDSPLGAVFRGELIIVLDTKCERVARSEHRKRLRKIMSIIEAQTWQIQTFNHNLRDYLEDLIAGPAAGGGLLH